MARLPRGRPETGACCAAGARAAGKAKGMSAKPAHRSRTALWLGTGHLRTDTPRDEHNDRASTAPPRAAGRYVALLEFTASRTQLVSRLLEGDTPAPSESTLETPVNGLRSFGIRCVCGSSSTAVLLFLFNISVIFPHRYPSSASSNQMVGP